MKKINAKLNSLIGGGNSRLSGGDGNVVLLLQEKDDVANDAEGRMRA